MADDWLEITPIEPPVLNNSMLEILVAPAVTANCSGISSVTLVPANSGAKVAASEVFWICTLREMRV